MIKNQINVFVQKSMGMLLQTLILNNIPTSEKQG